MTFADRLREERRRARLTTRELASAAEISQPHVVRMESGRIEPTIATASRIANALGMGLADLVWDGPPLFEVEFDVGPVTGVTPWIERRILASVPDPVRVSAWPYLGDGKLRLRTRASSLPVLAGLVGTVVPGLDLKLPAPTVSPVRGSAELAVVVKAVDEDEARHKLAESTEDSGCKIVVRNFGPSGLWLGTLKGVGKGLSVAMQGLSASSPLGLFVPA